MTKKKKYTNKRERFLEVAESRTNSVLNRIRILGNCGNRSLYDYREDEVNKMFRAVQKALDVNKAKFTAQKKKEKKFSL